MNSKTPECWSIDPQVRGLRVELSPTHSLVLPFEHFIYSELEVGDDEDSLKLAFATHEVVLKGGQLRRVEAAAQRLELALVAVVPEIYQPIAGGTQPFIKEILVMSPTSPGKAEQEAVFEACTFVISTDPSMKQIPNTPATNGVGSAWSSPQSSPLVLPGSPATIPLADEARMADTQNVTAPADMTERLAYSVQEAADMLGVNYFSVYRLIQRGKLRVCRALRGKLLVPRTELLKLLKTE